MNPETLELLRSATIQALQNKQDVAAVELLSLMDMKGQALPPLQQQQLPLPTEEAVVPALPRTSESRDYHFWVAVIRDDYLPHLKRENQTQFTTAEFFSWVDYTGFPLTVGDLEKPGGTRPRWKERCGDALKRLRDTGEIYQLGFFGKTYSTVQPQVAIAAG